MTYGLDHIEKFYKGQKEAISILINQKQISLASDSEGILAKTLILAIASYFEDCITKSVFDHIREHSSHVSVSEFCRITGIERRYHTWFNWTDQNANEFFSKFGKDTKAKAAARCKQDDALSQAVKSFMYLGSQRNLIIHGNMLAVTLNDTSDEIMLKAKDAIGFVNYVSNDLFS